MKKELIDGKTFHFNNENWCEQHHSDDMSEGHIQWNNRFGFGLFCIFFNGSCIHTSKTFNSAKKRLDTLFAKWKLEFTTIEDWYEK